MQAWDNRGLEIRRDSETVAYLKGAMGDDGPPTMHFIVDALNEKEQRDAWATSGRAAIIDGFLFGVPIDLWHAVWVAANWRGVGIADVPDMIRRVEVLVPD